MIRFAIAALATAAVLWAGVHLGAYQHWWHVLPPYRSEIVGFLLLTTVILYWVLARFTRTQVFTQAYLLSMVLKMGVYAAFILVVIFVDPAGAPTNSAFFLAGYLLFTALEVGFLFKSVNR